MCLVVVPYPYGPNVVRGTPYPVLGGETPYGVSGGISPLGGGRDPQGCGGGLLLVTPSYKRERVIIYPPYKWGGGEGCLRRGAGP